MSSSKPTRFEKAKNKVIKGLKIRLHQLNLSLNQILEEMKIAKDVDSIMRLKREYLYVFVDNLPLGRDTCIFCCIDKYSCDNCLYGKYFGKCIHTNKKANYSKVSKPKDDLLKAILKYYYDEKLIIKSELNDLQKRLNKYENSY